MRLFVIEDEIHAEIQGEFSSWDEAVAELQRRAKIPWNEKPNVCPCQSWKTCGREYYIIEYDNKGTPWQELRRTPALKVSAIGITWDADFEAKL